MVPFILVEEILLGGCAAVTVREGYSTHLDHSAEVATDLFVQLSAGEAKR